MPVDFCCFVFSLFVCYHHGDDKVQSFMCYCEYEKKGQPIQGVYLCCWNWLKVCCLLVCVLILKTSLVFYAEHIFTNAIFVANCRMKHLFFTEFFLPKKLKQNISKWIPESKNDDVFGRNDDDDDEIGYWNNRISIMIMIITRKNIINYFKWIQTKNQLKFQNDDSIYHEQSSSSL